MNYLDSVQKAINLLEKNIEDNIELNNIAKTAMMSLPHLYRMFYSLTGHPIKDYVRKRRISVSSEHLKNSKKSIMDIALDCGFESQASFSKSFKKIVGVTPKNYRESDMYYCFERIDLFERVTYIEGRELFERYPEVNVIYVKDMTVFSYIYKSNRLEGIEKDAFKYVQQLIQNAKLDNKKIQCFGRNLNLEDDEVSHYNSNRYAYEMLIYAKGDLNFTIEGMKIKDIHGGMYAVGSTQSDSDKEIISLWNRIYSEWLPKSLFKEGSHTYLEEYITYSQKLVRMKLYLPIERQLKPELIKIEEVETFQVAYCKVFGLDSLDKADKTLSQWLETDSSLDCTNSNLYVSYNYGNKDKVEYWSEYGITTSSNCKKIHNPNIKQKTLGGGLFAVIETKAYGTLIGVLEMIHRWIVGEKKYILDDSRQWFAQYNSSPFKSNSNEVTVRSYIPINERSK
ncbi:helix-turn-helix domain-containing protein [Cytobacillus sp. Hm23]